MKKERIKVYLDKNRKDKNDFSYIFLTYTNSGREFFYTEFKAKMDFWDEAEGKIDLSKLKSKEEKEAGLKTNDRIDEIKRRIQRISDRLSFDIEPTAKLVKAKYLEEEEKETNRKNKEFNQQNPEIQESTKEENIAKELTFLQYLDEFIKQRSEFQSVSTATLKKYRTAHEHLKLFIHHRQFIPLFLDDITVKKFEEPYRHFMRYQYIQNSYLDENNKVHIPKDKKGKPKLVIGLAENSLVKDLKVVVTIMKDLIEDGKTKNKDYKNFDLEEYTSDAPPLPPEYFKVIVKATFPARPALQKTLDKFIIGCITSLRYEDLNNLLKDRVHINKEELALSYVELRSQKGKKTISEIYYLGVLGAKIMAKYLNDPLTGEYALYKISGKNFNEHLKEIGQLLGFDKITVVETVKKNKDKNGKVKNTLIEKVPFYELMTSHMMRRTSVTYMKRKLDDRMTMKQSHHKTRENLDKYNKFADEELAKAINNVWEQHSS